MDPRYVELERLYRDEGLRLLRYLTRQVGDSAAEDLLQETFVAAAGNFAALANATSAAAWLFGIARNLTHGRRRRMKRDAAAALETEPATPMTEEDDRLDELRRAIRRLPEEQQEVLHLRLAEELSYAEIAEALKTPIGTVRSRLHAATQRLREWAREVTRHG